MLIERKFLGAPEANVIIGFRKTGPFNKEAGKRRRTGALRSSVHASRSQKAGGQGSGAGSDCASLTSSGLLTAPCAWIDALK